MDDILGQMLLVKESIGVIEEVTINCDCQGPVPLPAAISLPGPHWKPHLPSPVSPGINETPEPVPIMEHKLEPPPVTEPATPSIPKPGSFATSLPRMEGNVRSTPESVKLGQSTPESVEEHWVIDFETEPAPNSALLNSPQPYPSNFVHGLVPPCNLRTPLFPSSPLSTSSPLSIHLNSPSPWVHHECLSASQLPLLTPSTLATSPLACSVPRILWIHCCYSCPCLHFGLSAPLLFSSARPPSLPPSSRQLYLELPGLRCCHRAIVLMVSLGSPLCPALPQLVSPEAAHRRSICALPWPLQTPPVLCPSPAFHPPL